MKKSTLFWLAAGAAAAAGFVYVASKEGSNSPYVPGSYQALGANGRPEPKFTVGDYVQTAVAGMKGEVVSMGYAQGEWYYLVDRHDGQQPQRFSEGQIWRVDSSLLRMSPDFSEN